MRTKRRIGFTVREPSEQVEATPGESVSGEVVPTAPEYELDEEGAAKRRLKMRMRRRHGR